MPLSSQPINSTKNVEFSIAKFDISWPNKTMEAKMKRKKKIKKRIFPPFFLPGVDNVERHFRIQAH